jgi:hypothetical protein
MGAAAVTLESPLFRWGLRGRIVDGMRVDYAGHNITCSLEWGYPAPKQGAGRDCTGLGTQVLEQVLNAAHDP